MAEMRKTSKEFCQKCKYSISKLICMEREMEWTKRKRNLNLGEKKYMVAY